MFGDSKIFYVTHKLIEYLNFEFGVIKEKIYGLPSSRRLPTWMGRKYIESGSYRTESYRKNVKMGFSLPILFQPITGLVPPLSLGSHLLNWGKEDGQECRCRDTPIRISLHDVELTT